MSTLLIRNIDTVVTCDEKDRVLHNADLFIRDGRIVQLGEWNSRADEVIDGRGMICYPGLVNAHHHLYQVFSRNLPEVQKLELFDWLKALYEIWKNLNARTVLLSSMAGMGELVKNGCTTVFDHHYVFPEDCGDLPGAQAEAARRIGVRLHLSRGSMDLSVKDGGLPPDSVVQTVDEILKDSEDVIARFHDPSFGSMRRVALAPCSPFSVSEDLLRESAVLARENGVRLHTHLCETKDEERYTLEKKGMRPLAYMESLGWVGPDVWYAHGILGVDGSASNDGSDLQEEIRTAYLLHRLHSSADAPSGYEILKMATMGGARLLGREHEIGSLEIGKCGDLFLIRKDRLELAGACYDPGSLLATVGFRQSVDLTVVNGCVAVRDGRLTGIDEERLSAECGKEVRRYLGR